MDPYLGLGIYVVGVLITALVIRASTRAEEHEIGMLAVVWPLTISILVSYIAILSVGRFATLIIKRKR